MTDRTGHARKVRAAREQVVQAALEGVTYALDVLACYDHARTTRRARRALSTLARLAREGTGR